MFNLHITHRGVEFSGKQSTHLSADGGTIPTIRPTRTATCQNYPYPWRPLPEICLMKRLVIIAILLTVAISSAGCRRGVRLFGLRGGRCGNRAVPQQPAYYAVPSYSPTVSAPCECGTCPTNCCPTDCCPTDCCPTDGCSTGCSTINGGTVFDSGTGYDSGAFLPENAVPGVISPGAGTAPQLEPGFQTIPNPGGSASSNLYGKPIFSHVVGDRILKPGETVSGETFKTVSSPLN